MKIGITSLKKKKKMSDQELLNDIEIEYSKFYNYYKVHLSNSLFDKEPNFLGKHFHPKLATNNIFTCVNNDINSKSNNRLNVYKVLNKNVVTLKNVYANPFIVRYFVSQLPHFPNKEITKSFSPTYCASIPVLMPDLYKIVKYILIKYYADVGFTNIFLNENPVNFYFSTSLYSISNLIPDQVFSCTHDDGNCIAGIIYLNLPHEYNGGTAIYNKQGIEVFRANMEFNKLLMYNATDMHNFYFDDDIENSFSDKFRIIQRFFIKFPEK